MFLWDNEKDSDNMQRLKNGVFLKMWVKNETRDAVMPVVALIVVIFLIMLGIASLLEESR